MIKESNIQISAVIPKEIDEKLKRDAKKAFGSKNWMVRKILTDYYRNKEKGTN